MFTPLPIQVTLLCAGNQRSPVFKYCTVINNVIKDCLNFTPLCFKYCTVINNVIKDCLNFTPLCLHLLHSGMTEPANLGSKFQQHINHTEALTSD